MPRIKLVVTGDMEHQALAGSLRRIMLQAGCPDDVDFPEPLQVSPTASTRLPPVDTGPIPKPIVRLVSAMIAELEIGSDGRRADMVIGIDDIELDNLEQPEVMIGWVRRAVKEEIDRRPSQRGAAHLKKLLRESCSFHLLKPMAEAHFYAERAALLRAGVSPDVPVHRVGLDVEEFETDDPGFRSPAVAVNESHCASGRAWWREEKHPNRYLGYLCQQSGWTYYETRGGVDALRTLDWPAAAVNAQVIPFSRALFEDIADFIGMPSPLGRGPSHRLTFPTRSRRRSSLVLRNI